MTIEQSIDYGTWYFENVFMIVHEIFRHLFCRFHELTAAVKTESIEPDDIINARSSRAKNGEDILMRGTQDL